MIASADFYKAIAAAWTAGGLNEAFNSLWDASFSKADYPVLHDQEAQPGQPMPYCVMEQPRFRTVTRMSDSATAKREVKDVVAVFNVHAKAVGDRSAKRVAADLAEEMIKVFGGHPTSSPVQMTLDNGKHLITQLQADYGQRTGDQTYQWVVEFLFRMDVPVAV